MSNTSKTTPTLTQGRCKARPEISSAPCPTATYEEDPSWGRHVNDQEHLYTQSYDFGRAETSTPSYNPILQPHDLSSLYTIHHPDPWLNSSSCHPLLFNKRGFVFDSNLLSITWSMAQVKWLIHHVTICLLHHMTYHSSSLFTGFSSLLLTAFSSSLLTGFSSSFALIVLFFSSN